MRAAALVLLAGVARVVVGLIGRDRLVLDAVIGGQLAAAQREQRGREGDQRARQLAAGAGRAPAQERARDRGAGGDAEHARLLERQLGLGQRLLDQRDHGERLAEADEAAQAGDVVGRGHPRLGPGGDLDLAGLGADGGGPVGRAVHQQAVAQSHAAQAQLVLGDGHQVRSLRGRSWKKAAAKPRSRTSIRSSFACISGQVS
jgi:hypothetical protein